MRRLTLCLLLLCPFWAIAQEEEEDTTFQIARVRTLHEVLIKAEEPAWIREKLKLFIQRREENYQQEPCFREYDFFSKTQVPTSSVAPNEPLRTL